MFNKLVSNLPFNPSLISQVSFYAKRLHQESSIRRLGAIFVVLALLVQIFAIVSPPKPTLASSDNDIIFNGINSSNPKATMLAIWDSDHDSVGHTHLQSFYQNWGVQRSDIANSQLSTIVGGPVIYGQWWSFGRTPHQGDTDQYNLDTGTIYARPLGVWGQGITYNALVGKRADGVPFAIMLDCGNLALFNFPKPVAPTPPPSQPKEACTVSGIKYYQGWGFYYTSPDGSINNPAARKVDNPSPCTPKPPTPPPTPLPPPPPPPPPPLQKCPLDSSILITDAKCKTCPYDQGILKTNAACVQCLNPRYPTVTQSSAQCKPICPYNSAYDKDQAACKPCDASKDKEDKTACLELHKKATNNTQGLQDAQTKDANAGDVITYTLSVKNNGKADVDNFVIQENISDILDYADVTDFKGSHKDTSQVISWPAQTIKVGATIQQQFTIKVKDPIPQTPVSKSDPFHFDLTMTNIYGDVVNIKLPGSIIKTTETVSTTTLPNTGPGTSLLIGFGLFSVVGYFFARSRLLAKELDLVRNDYTVSGGL